MIMKYIKQVNKYSIFPFWLLLLYSKSSQAFKEIAALQTHQRQLKELNSFLEQ